MVAKAAHSTFRLLGELEVDGVPRASLGGPKQRALLAYLLLHANELVPRDRLVDSVWGEHPPPTAQSIVHGYVRKLRAALEETDARITARSPGYVLEVDLEELDLRRFEHLVQAGRESLVEGDPQGARAFLTDALALWRGEPLADLLYEPAVQAEARRLGELRLEATMDRSDADLELGANGALVGELDSLVSRHPLSERLRGQLMLALYRAGRQADALEAYRQARGVLAEELGLEPGPNLQQLEQAILRHDSALGGRPAPSAPASRRRRAVLATIVGIAAVAVALALTISNSGPPALRVRANTLGVIDPHSNRLVATIPSGVRPGPVTVGGGSVWVASLADETLTRINPRKRRVEHTIPLNAFANGLAAGADAIWVVDAYTSSVTRVSPDANAVLRTVDMPYDPARYEHGCSANPGAVRAAIAVGDSEVRAVCPSGIQTTIGVHSAAVKSNDLDLLDPSAVAYGLGSVWIASRDDNTVTQIDPVSNTHRRTITVASEPDAIVVADGSVWVASFREGVVSRIRFPGPDYSPAVDTVRVGRAPIAIAAGEGGIWVANSGDHTVSRIDPHGDRVAATIKIGPGVPAGIAAGEGAVWVTAQSP